MATVTSRPSTDALRIAAHRFHTLLGVQVEAAASFAPAQVVTNKDLAELGYDADWIIQRTGIRERRYAPPGMTTSDLAYEASRRCLERAQVEPDELDLILVATVSPDMPMPATACHLQRKLGAAAPAMDLNAACAGFLFAMVTGAQYVHSGAARRVLVVGADIMSRMVNPEDRKTYPLFGDGAGAVLLSRGAGDQGLLAYGLGADGRGAGLLCMPAGGSQEPVTPEALAAKRNYMYMDGRPVFKWAVRLVADAIRDVAAAAAISVSEIGAVVLHQANRRILDAVAADVGLDPRRLVVNLDRYGNTSAGSIPLALDEAWQQGRIRRGDLVLLCGFGAGLAWGTALMRW